MNSSFADSIADNMDNRPSTALITQSNTNNALNSVLNNMQPLKTLDSNVSSSANRLHLKEQETNSIAPSDGEDSWLNALITNKKTEPKKIIVSSLFKLKLFLFTLLTF